MCSVNLQLISQNEESMPDVSAENWLAGSFTYSINNKWKFSFQEQVRFKYTINPLDRILTQFELENSSKNKKKIFNSIGDLLSDIITKAIMMKPH